MLYGQGPQFWLSFPYHHRIPSDLNLSAFLAWILSAPLRAQYEVERARQPISVHRHPLASGPVRQFDLSRLMASKPCNQLDVGCERCDTRGGYKWPWDGPWVCVEGRGGGGGGGGAPHASTETPSNRSSSRVEIRTAQVTEASETSQQTPKGSEMGSQVSIGIHRAPSECAEVRVSRMARRAIRQFCRENVTLHKGQVITSEAQLVVIFGQRVVDKVRATIAVDTKKTSNRRLVSFS